MTQDAVTRHKFSSHHHDEIAKEAMPYIQKYASPELLAKVSPELLHETISKLYRTLKCIPYTFLIPNGGDMCPGLGLDVLILKDPKFATLDKKKANLKERLPDSGNPQFNEDALRVLGSAALNCSQQTGEGIMALKYGKKGEYSYAMIFEPQYQKEILDSYELELV